MIYEIVRKEIISYGAGLANKTEKVVLNKCDILNDKVINQKEQILREVSGADVFPVSSLTRIGVDDLVKKLFYFIKELSADNKLKRK